MTTAAGGQVEIKVVADTDGFNDDLKGKLEESSSAAESAGQAIGAALALGGAAAATGLAFAIDKGMEFDSILNSIQGSTGATAEQMSKVSETALQLGSDTTLAGVSASGAADAINELAKGGLTLDQSIAAARGTIQLATAGQLDFGRAAEIVSNSLAQFNLQATDAGRVGDVLAAASVASTAGVEDLAQALNYAGPSAAGLKISLEDTTTALAILAQSGTKGSEAGTQLRGMLVSLAAPSKQAAGALKTLGVNAFTSSGEFVGLEALSGQLATAQGKLSDQAFNAATSVAFGRESMGAAIALAKGGAPAFDTMGDAVRRQGAASDLAASNTRGLGGAIESLQGGIETASIRIYDLIKGPLEGLVRAAGDGVDGINGLLSGGFDVSKLEAVNIAVDTGRQLWSDFGTVLDNAKSAAAPVARGLDDLFGSLDKSGGVLATAAQGLTVLSGAAAVASGAFEPIGAVVGGAVSIFSALPGPLQAAVLGFLAFKIVPGLLTGMNTALSKVPIVGAGAASALSNLGGRITALPGQATAAATGLRNFGQQVQVQQSLARLGGQEIGRFGGTVAALATRLPATSAALGAMGRSFTSVNAPLQNLGTRLAGTAGPLGTFAGGLSRVAGVGLGGIAAGVTGIARAGAGLFSALGGIPGLLITGVVVGLSLLAQKSAEAKQKAEEFKASTQELKGTLQDYTGEVTNATNALIAKNLAEDGSLLALDRLGISQKTYLDAIKGVPAAQDEVRSKLDATTKSSIEGSSAWKDHGEELRNAGVSLDLLTRAASGDQVAIDELNTKVNDAANNGLPVFGDALRKAKDDLLGAGQESGKLAEKLGLTQAQLKSAQEQVRLAAQDTAAFKAALEGVQPALAGLATGAKLSPELSAELRSVTAAAITTSNAVGDLARDQFKSVESGAAAAAESMKASRQAFIDAAVGAGATQEKAEALANSMGLIPSAASIIFTSNATGVNAEMVTLSQQISAVPAGKDVVVAAITDEARAKLMDLGFTVTTLPDGTIKITGNDDAARAKLGDVTALIQSTTAQMLLSADKAPAEAVFNAAVVDAGGKTGTMKLDGDPTLVNGKVQQSVTFADGSKGTITLDGNPDPATGKITAVVRDGNGRTTTMQVAANVNQANSQMSGFVQRWNGFQITGTAVVSSRVGGLAAGGIVEAYAKGGLRNAAPSHYDGHRLTPMSGGSAKFVAPRSYRVIGDNVKVPELYLPMDPRNKRSQRLFEIAAARMGYAVSKVSAYADGGFERLDSAVLSRRIGQSSFTDAGIIAELRNLSARLDSVQRGDIYVTQHAHNPVAEKASDTLVKRMRTLGQMGAFG